MTYIDYLNSFNQWLESNTLPGNAQLLFFRLLNVFNRAGWPEYVQVDTRRLTILADCEKDAAYRARDKLCDAGFLNYRKGKKGSPTIYFLSDKTTESTTETATVSATESATVSATHIKTKTKNKKKETSPYGDEKKAAVAAVMSAYLDKVNPQLSERSRDELVGFAEVMGAEVCLRAIDIALDAKKASWPYIRAILQSKQQQGVRCLADWDALEDSRLARKEQINGGAKGNYDPDDWSDCSL